VNWHNIRSEGEETPPRPIQRRDAILEPEACLLLSHHSYVDVASARSRVVERESCRGFRLAHKSTR
jgi:hypothetical protein